MRLIVEIYRLRVAQVKGLAGFPPTMLDASAIIDDVVSLIGTLDVLNSIDLTGNLALSSKNVVSTRPRSIAALCLENNNSQLRKIIKTRGHFPSDEAARKLIWLALGNITADWGRAAHDWKTAMNQFAILYADRFVRPSVRFSTPP